MFELKIFNVVLYLQVGTEREKVGCLYDDEYGLQVISVTTKSAIGHTLT